MAKKMFNAVSMKTEDPKLPNLNFRLVDDRDGNVILQCRKSGDLGDLWYFILMIDACSGSVKRFDCVPKTLGLNVFPDTGKIIISRFQAKNNGVKAEL